MNELDELRARVRHLERMLVHVTTSASPSSIAWAQADAEVSRILARRPDLAPRPYVTSAEKLAAGQEPVTWRSVSVG